MITWNPKRVYALAIDIWFEGDEEEAHRAYVLRNLRSLKEHK